MGQAQGTPPILAICQTTQPARGRCWITWESQCWGVLAPEFSWVLFGAREKSDVGLMPDNLGIISSPFIFVDISHKSLEVEL